MAVYYNYDKEKLVANPVVYEYNERRHRILLCTDFRIRLFELWKEGKRKELKDLLAENELGEDDIGKGFTLNLINGFAQSGYPVHRKEEIASKENFEEKNPLVLSGAFHRRDGVLEGLRMDEGFKEKLFRSYPQTAIEDMLMSSGINPVDAGYQRIRKLKMEFDERLREECGSTERTGSDVGESGTGKSGTGEDTGGKGKDAGAIDDLLFYGHPYVEIVRGSEPVLGDAFYDETCLLTNIPLDEIFECYELNKDLFDTKARMLIRSTQLRWTRTDPKEREWSKQVLRIQKKRIRLMEKAVSEGFGIIRSIFPGLPIDSRRMVCRQISRLPADPEKHYTVRHILQLIGLPKSSYYEILNNERYGESRKRKALQDDEDVMSVIRTLDYKGFAKGIRQVYMLMPSVTGRSFSINKIRRLMRKYGLRTNIRRPSRNRKSMKELIERNKKSNILLRKFRMHRPDEVRLTDVTYLEYGSGRRAYGSASIDPATGKLICFVISENNDLELALETLREMDRSPARTGAILHSDQGILYFSDAFQAAVVERELEQSMSRRGNCWDNAPQEAFFGHFKDESGYEKCQTLQELRDTVEKYMVYYNEERGIWERERMTPAEYEAYLNDMSDDEFRKYIEKEEEKYRKTKEESAKKAVKRAMDQRDGIPAVWEEKNEENKE